MVCPRCEMVSDLALDSVRDTVENPFDVLNSIHVLKEYGFVASNFTRSELLVAAELLSSRPEIAMQRIICARMQTTEVNVRVLVSRVRRKLPRGWRIATFRGCGWKIYHPGEKVDCGDEHFLGKSKTYGLERE